MEKITVLKGLLNRSRFLLYSPALQKLKNFGEEPTIILRTIEQYYDTYPDEDEISVDELQTFFDLNWPQIKNPSLYQEYFGEMRSVQIKNDALLVQALNKVVSQDICAEIAIEATTGMEAHTNQVDRISELLERHKEITETVGDESKEEISLDLDELLEETQTFDFNWRLPFLRESLGKPRPGVLGQIFATPETGKSSFGIAEATFFALQMKNPEDKVLYMNNEEPIQRLALRMYVAAAGKSLDFILRDKQTYKKKFMSKVAPNLVCRGQVYTIYQVEELLKRYKPKVAIIDQGPKVDAPALETNEVKKLQMVFERYRRLASQYKCMILSMAQADGESENKKWLGLKNMFFSKVGVQGELDFAIGIGAEQSEGENSKRYLNICKNKLTGIHSRQVVYFDTKTCRYTPMGQAGGKE